MYLGDTALHMAAASCQPVVVEKLISIGADVRARNRRGAEPLHYAVDGGPGLPAWNASAQAKVIAMLVGAGADLDAIDKGGIAPLHRAVRNRCSGDSPGVIARNVGAVASGSTITNSELSANRMYSDRLTSGN